MLIFTIKTSIVNSPSCSGLWQLWKFVLLLFCFQKYRHVRNTYLSIILKSQTSHEYCCMEVGLTAHRLLYDKWTANDIENDSFLESAIFYHPYKVFWLSLNSNADIVRGLSCQQSYCNFLSLYKLIIIIPFILSYKEHLAIRRTFP